MKRIAKSLGDDCLIIGEGNKAIERIPIPLHYLSRDIGGGLPKGRLIELFGFEESGKTTLALTLAAAIQKVGPILYLDTEHTLDQKYAKKVGLQLNDSWIYTEPNTMEECFKIIKIMLEENAIAGFVFDSLPAAATQYEMDQSIDDEGGIAAQARVISRCLRRILGWVSSRNIIGIFINHLKDEIGGNTRYKTHVTPGGRALKFYSSLRLRINKGQSDYLQNDGFRSIVKVIKTKVGGHRNSSSEYHIRFKKGIAREFELYELGLETGVINRRGAWYTIGDKRVQGRESVIELLCSYKQIRAKIIQAAKELSK